MCGICGVIGARHSDTAESRVRAMLAALVRRGPDDEGLFPAPRALLGMRRLSIIDLEGGNQPVYNEDRSVAILYNGEIYNFPELRTALEARGHRFATHSDTETVVHAYEEWGTACLQRLRGMFALALWDGRAKSEKILLARDRLGIKPLYYAQADGELLFASEVRALLASGSVARTLVPQALHSYLLFGSVVEPMTLIEGISSLLPGHFMVVDCDAPIQAAPKPYWDLASNVAQHAESSQPKSIASAAHVVRPLLDEAVRSHLIADVPLGVFLSSGLDSTALAALASRERSGLHTFTVAFEEREFSEAPLARSIAGRLRTQHSELLLTGEEMQRRMNEAVAALDQPSMDGINTFFVSWAARQVGLKVALSGLGGDEVFGGYPTFHSTPRLAKLASMSRLLPAGARKLLAGAMLTAGRRGTNSHRCDALRKAAAICAEPTALPHPYFFSRMLFTPRQTGMLFSEAGRAALAGNSPEVLIGSSAPWSAWLEATVEGASRLRGDAAVSFLELRTYMLDTLLRDTDSMSMHHSLEVRVPLLDHPLVESVLALPDSAKRASGSSKALLVEAMGASLPQEALHKPKRTFTLPWERWLRGPLGLQVAVRLGGLTPSLAAALDPAFVQTIWRSFLLRHTGWARPWSLFVLDAWVRRHVDETSDKAEPGKAKSSPAASVSTAGLS